MKRGKEGNRIFWLDAARTFAIISISLNHAVNRAYDNYNDQMAEFLAIPFPSTLFKTAISVLSRLGVPFFLMISGTLLLRKNIKDEDGINRFYKHNVLNLLITSEIWYFLMYWIISIGRLVKAEGSILTNALDLLWGLCKTMLFMDQVSFDSMWYIPMILCVYLLIPVFALAFNRASLKIVAIPCGVVFCSTMLIANVNSFLLIAGIDKQIDFALRSLNVFSGYFLYVFLGYWISTGGLQTLKKELVILLTCISFCMCFAMQLYAYSRPVNYLVEYDFSFVLLTSVFLFELFRRMPILKGLAQNVITYISKISFGIFFVHVIIMVFVRKLPIYDNWPRPLLVIFLEVFSIGSSVAVIWVLSHIDIFKRRLFLIKD